MALHRTISISFWTDSKIVDDFTPEDRYFYLYLFTNPHTNLCGCYEVSIRQISNEIGYSKASVENLIERFENVHKVITYSRQTKEMLLLNWHKYNWTGSSKLQIALDREIAAVKDDRFRAYMEQIRNGEDRVSIPYGYPISSNNSITNTDSNTDTDSNTKGQVRHKYGEYQNVLLSDDDIEKLKTEFPADWERWIDKLSSGIASKGYKYKSHLAAIRNWARREEKGKSGKTGFNDFQQRAYDWDDLAKKLQGV